MEKDIDEIKPRKWLVVILIIVAITIGIILINKVITDKKEKDKNKETHSIFDIFDFEKIESSFEKESFNASYEQYSGSKSGFFLENLFEKVITNNKKNANKKISIKYNEINTTDPEEIKNIKKGINSGDKFEVSINYNENGFVNEIEIELTEKDKSKLNGFNSTYELYAGTESGFRVKYLLDKVITNNKTNSTRILTVIYKDTNTTDVETIKNLKSNFSDRIDYEVSLNYNDEGYVYQIVIE